MSTRHSVVETTLGEVTLVAEADRISGLYFRRHRHKPSQVAFGDHVDVHDDALFRAAGTQLWEYLYGQRDRSTCRPWHAATPSRSVSGPW